MSPSRKGKPKKPARKVARKKATAKARKVAARKAPARKAPARRAAPARPTAPPRPQPWTPDIVGLNLAWYSVTDWARAKQFYGGTLGLPVAYAVEEQGWIEYGRGELYHLAISKWDQPGPVPVAGGVAVLTCQDVRRAIERLRMRGVRCEEVSEIPGMVILGTFYDPDGNKIQLAQSLVS